MGSFPSQQVGLGTFPLAGAFSTLADSPDAIVSGFLDAGGSYIDTAPTYKYGDVERVLSEILTKRPRDSFFVNTSCGYVLDADGKTFRVSGRRADVIDDCKASLERLGLDYIDSYISHIPDPDTPFSETVAALEELRAAGKVRFIGVSNVSLEQLKEYNVGGSISVVQNRLSYLNRAIDTEFSAYCEGHGISIVAYQVIERGMLTDKGAGVFELREGDLRASKPEFGDDRRAAVAEWLTDRIVPLARQHQVSIQTLVVWWGLRQPAVAVCQMGATSAAQARGLAEVQSFAPADPDELSAQLDDAYADFERRAAEHTNGGSVRDFLGLTTYNTYSGSASGVSAPAAK